MGDYQPYHESQSIHCATGKSHYVRHDIVSVAEAIAYARTALAEVRARLQSIGVDQQDLDTAFAEILAGLEGDPGRNGNSGRDGGPGHEKRSRRESAAAKALSPILPDTPGQDLRPDPGDARTAAGFLECLRDYRAWAGNPSYRVMARRCGHRFAASTICTALRGDAIPSMDMVLAIVAACGGPEQHQREFASAWRRLVLPRPREAEAVMHRQVLPDPAA